VLSRGIVNRVCLLHVVIVQHAIYIRKAPYHISIGPTIYRIRTACTVLKKPCALFWLVKPEELERTSILAIRLTVVFDEKQARAN